MKKILTILIFLHFAYSLYAVEILVRDTVSQGGVVTVYLKQGSPDRNVYLKKDGAVKVKTKSFDFVLDKKKVVIALIGIPSSLEEGVYKIETEDAQTKMIRVGERIFFKEDLYLNKEMTNLRKSDNGAKKTQSITLSDILLTTNTESVFEKDNFIKPVKEKRITSSFGEKRIYRYSDGTSAKSIHTGIDYSADIGTPVYACGDGRVVFADFRIITGLTVVIEHLPGVYSLYYHLQAIRVQNGKMIKTGDLLGDVGSTGLSTGAHLHWEIRVAAVPVKPELTITNGIIDKSFILSIIKEQ